MAVSDKKKAAFANLIIRLKETRKNESLDGRTDGNSSDQGVGSGISDAAGSGAVRVAGGEPGGPGAGGNTGDPSSEQGQVAGPGGDFGGSQAVGGGASPGEGESGTETAGRRVKPRPQAELSAEERNFIIAPGEEPQPRGRDSRLRANLNAIRLLRTLEAEDRLATPEEQS